MGKIISETLLYPSFTSFETVTFLHLPCTGEEIMIESRRIIVKSVGDEKWAAPTFLRNKNQSDTILLSCGEARRQHRNPSQGSFSDRL